jgi:ParB family chromosome partitioning protein
VASPKRKGLGKGLDALISQKQTAPAPENAPGDQDRVLHLDPRAIKPNPHQPRSTFSEEALEELAASIRREGVQEPVLVRRKGDEYELISGERRVRASVMADMATIPAIAREASDDDMLRLGLIENIQREDLNAIELARAYSRLVEEFSWTQEELAEQVGKKRATVANSMRLLNLPDDVQKAVAEDKISMGHARALLAIESPEAQSAACRRIVEEGLSVRQVEKMANPQPVRKKRAAAKDPLLADLEDDLRRRLGTRVAVRSNGANRGKIEIDYYNLDDLERILDRLRG